MPARYWQVLAALPVLAALYYGVLFFAQRRLLFPAPAPSLAAARGSAEVVRLTLPEGNVECLYLAPAAAQRGPAPLIVFAHGNGELAEWWVDQFETPRGWGFAVLLLEYPGYGRSAGAPSERSIVAATLAAHDWARADPRVDPNRIVGYGRSLGGGAIARLAAERPLAAVILESSFTSVRAFAGGFLAPGFLVRDPFDNLEQLAGFRGPLLVLHGEHDAIAPLAHGRALAAAVPGAELETLPCGHNDCPRSWPRIHAFLLKRGLKP
jgi:pimeloyl-ACP methyl ester carboxylesterase